MNEPPSNDLVEHILEEYLNRLNRGELPDIETYCSEYPDCADELREIAQTMNLANISVSNGLVELPLGNESTELPERIGDYRILREIGRGGMGVVYEAEHESLGRLVALKVLFQRYAQDETAIERFHREARAIAKLHHTSIVPLFEVGSDDGQFFLAMQLIRGQSLDQVVDALKNAKGESGSGSVLGLLRSDGSSASNIAQRDATKEDSQSLSAGKSRKYYKRIAEIGAQAAEALHHAHRRGIIHRDVKPSNLLLDEEGAVWLTDFGLAKTEDDAMTRTGDIVGTIRYMAPERFKGKCDERSDLYALGLTMYELLTLHRAFEYADQVEMLGLIANEEPLRPRSIQPQIPRDLETVVLKAFDKTPHRRYAGASEFAEDLLRFSRDEPIQARRLSMGERYVRWTQRNPGLSAAFASIGALLLILVFGSVVVSLQQAKLRAKAENNARIAENAKGDALTAQKAAEEALSLAERRELSGKRSQYFAEMNLAGQRIGRAGHTRQLGRVTDRWRKESIPGLLGWEWYYLRAVSMDSAVVFSDQASDHVSTASWSSDGKYVVVAYRGHDSDTSSEEISAPRICDVASGKTLHVLNGHEAEVTCVDWHPRLPLIASSATNGTIRFWDATTGKCLQRVGPFRGEPTYVAWSPSGDRLACATYHKNAGSLFVLATTEVPTRNQSVPRLHGNLPRLRINRDLTWSPDEKRVAATGSSGEYEQDIKSAIFDVELAKVARPPFEAAGVLWKPNGHELSYYLVNERSGQIQLWNAATNQEVGRFVGHTAQMFLFEFSPDGKRLATGGFDKTVRIWDVESRQSLRVFQEHPGNVFVIRWNRSGDHILSGSWGKDTRSWQVNDPCSAVILASDDQDSDSEILDIDWHPNSRWLAAAGPKIAGVWDTETRQLIDQQSKEADGRWFGGCEWDRTGKQLAYYGAGTNIHKVDSAGKLEFSSRLRGWTHRLEWHPDGTQILAAANKDINVVSSEEALATHKWNQTEILLTSASRHAAVRWNPKNHSAFAMATGNEISIIDRASGTRFELSGHTAEVLDLDWHPDGTQLLSASSDGTALIWNIEERSIVHALHGHNNIVNQVSWAPNGHRVATAGRDGTVKVWDPVVGVEILSLSSLGSAVNCVEWSPDSRKLAAGDLSGKIVIWDTTRSRE